MIAISFRKGRPEEKYFSSGQVSIVEPTREGRRGPPRIATKGSTGQVEGRQAYASYGEKILIDGSYVPLTGYTGHVQADPTGLIYMRGRFYSPAWHSFVNSDQGVDPSGWNQKAYAGGSPFMATDPSGMRKSQPGARNSWAADWSRIFGFWLSDSYGINSAVVEVTDASPFPDYFDVGYSPPFGWGYDGALFETGRVAPAEPQTPKRLSAAKYAALRMMLAQEKSHGTTGMALRQAYVFNSIDRDWLGNTSRGNSILFASPQNMNPTPTSAGPMDLDWFITLNAAARIKALGVATGYVGKLAWNTLNLPFDMAQGRSMYDSWESPFNGDPGEATAMDAYAGGKSLSDLFPPALLNQLCPPE